MASAAPSLASRCSLRSHRPLRTSCPARTTPSGRRDASTPDVHDPARLRLTESSFEREGNLKMSVNRSRSIGAFTQCSAAWNIKRFGYVQRASAAHEKTESSNSLENVDATFGMFQLVFYLAGLNNGCPPLSFRHISTTQSVG